MTENATVILTIAIDERDDIHLLGIVLRIAPMPTLIWLRLWLDDGTLHAEELLAREEHHSRQDPEHKQNDERPQEDLEQQCDKLQNVKHGQSLQVERKPKAFVGSRF